MSTSKVIQASTLPPAQPVYILRGHPAPVHTLLILRNNTRLFSGDSEGWAVLWSIPIRRPVAVWRAHESTILGASSWHEDKIITHGREGKICVWQLGMHNEDGLCTDLPHEGEDATHWKHPWLVHTLEVPAMNFCAFTSCQVPPSKIVIEYNASIGDADGEETKVPDTDRSLEDALLIAVAGASESEIEIYRLPDAQKVGVIPAPDQAQGKTGMVMTLKMLQSPSGAVIVIAGYESGRTYVYRQNSQAGSWEVRYTSRPHLQPILSLDVNLALNAFFTSSADAIVAKHPLSLLAINDTTLKEVQTKHAGQQGLHLRSDGKIFATAGWDSRVRVYSAKTLKELAVLKWHKDGCYATAFADVDVSCNDAYWSTTQSPAKSSTNQLAMREPQSKYQALVELERNNKAQTTHWLAAGSKDGKISLWDIY